MRKITMVGLLVGAVFAVGCGAAGGDTEVTGGAGTGAEGQSAEKVAGVGDPVRDGKFEFTVEKVKCGVNKVGSDLLGEKAQGQFCLATIKVTNIGKEPQTFSDSDQKAYAADGTEYSSNSSASLYANDEDSTFYNEINPGNEITGVVVFDIPKDVKLAKLELHDSFLSGGVTVKLG